MVWVFIFYFSHNRLCFSNLCYGFVTNSHAIAGGFSPAIATALYTKFGVNAAGMVYVVFGSISVTGLYFNYCCGGGDKEEDTGASPTNQDEGLEMQDNKVDNGDPNIDSVKDSPGSFKNIV